MKLLKRLNELFWPHQEVEAKKKKNSTWVPQFTKDLNLLRLLKNLYFNSCTIIKQEEHHKVISGRLLPSSLFKQLLTTSQSQITKIWPHSYPSIIQPLYCLPVPTLQHKRRLICITIYRRLNNAHFNGQHFIIQLEILCCVHKPISTLSLCSFCNFVQ